MFSGAEIRPRMYVTFFPILKKNNLPKNLDFHSVNTHTIYMVTLSFNLMAIVYVMVHLFFY